MTPSGSGVDLIEELRKIEQRATKAMNALNSGGAVTGIHALQEIRWLAGDAIVHATGDQPVSADRT